MPIAVICDTCDTRVPDAEPRWGVHATWPAASQDTAMAAFINDGQWVFCSPACLAAWLQPRPVSWWKDQLAREEAAQAERLVTAFPSPLR